MFVARWIKTEEAMPEINQDVLVYTKNGKVAKTTYLENGFKTHNKTVECWMPLPSAPTSCYGHEFEDDFFGAVINCAVRYACGRQSYMPSLIIDVVRPMLPMLSNKTIGCMERDIREAEKYGGYGDENIDKPGWMRLLKDLQGVMDERGIQRYQ